MSNQHEENNDLCNEIGANEFVLLQNNCGWSLKWHKDSKIVLMPSVDSELHVTARILPRFEIHISGKAGKHKDVLLSQPLVLKQLTME